MKLEKQNLLFFSRSTQHGGTENVIIQLCEIFHPVVNKIVVASANGFAVEKLHSYGIKHYTIPDIENKAPSTIISVLKIIKRIVEDEHITVIHTHHRMAAFYCQLIPHKELILINTSHTVFYDKKYLTQFAFRKMNLIACGKTVKDSLEEYQGIVQERIKVIPNAIKPFTRSISIIKEIDDYKKEGYMAAGVIGRLSYEKGVINLVEAAKELRDLKIRFFIVGSGDEEERIRTRIADCGLNDYFVFLGYRSDAQNVAAQLDFLILPSLQEGLPLVPIEAFSVSTPVLATDVGGTKEVVVDGYNGILIEAENEKALCEAIRKMSSSDLTKYRNNAYRTYIDKFSYELFAKKYLDYYKGL